MSKAPTPTEPPSFHEERWLDSFKQVVEFSKEKGTLPSTKAGGTEGSLGRWINHQRRHGDNLLPHRRALLEQHVPRALQPRRMIGWNEGLALVAQFDQVQGRTPRQIGPGVPADEAQLGIWWRDQKRDFHLLAEPTRKLRIAEALAFGLNPEDKSRKAETVHAEWFMHLQNYAKFTSVHGRRPKANEPHEKFLAGWGVANQMRYQSGAMQPDRAVQFAEKCPDLLQSRRFGQTKESAWDEKFDQCTAFYAEHGRSPVNTPEITEELRLRAWSTSQRRKHEAGKLSADQVERIANLAPWIFTGQEDERRSYFEELSRNRPSIPAVPDSSVSWWKSLGDYLSFLDAHDRLPSAKSKNPSERRQATWLNTSIRNARAETGDPVRRAVLAKWHPRLMS